MLTDTNGKPTRLDAVTRVENEVPLTVMVHAAPTAAQPGETLDVALTVSNTSPFERAGVRLHLRYPQGLNTLAETAISDGGVCDDSVGNNANCEPLETVIWDFATLAPGAEVTVSLPPVVSTQPEGSLIAFDAWVQDSLDRSRASDTVRIGDPEPVSDSDGDGIADDIDNCTADSNADQLDSDGDGYGNQCDTDLNNDGIANILDLGLFKLALRTDDPAADFNGDGLVDELDRTIFRDRFLTAPGPSALAP